MKVKVDQDLCIACGICEGGDLPEVFHIGDSGFAEVIMCPVEADFHDMLQQVAEACPTAAIQIKELNAQNRKRKRQRELAVAQMPANPLRTYQPIQTPKGM